MRREKKKKGKSDYNVLNWLLSVAVPGRLYIPEDGSWATEETVVPWLLSPCPP